jgi:hypothetical protein
MASAFEKEIMTTKTISKLPPPPPDWGEDALTRSFDDARSNQWATFVRKKPIVAKLIEFDTLFASVSKDWLNPQQISTALLFIRTHAAFRTSAGLAMSGMAPETYVLSRSMLECAAYALHIHRNPALETVWLNRHQDAASQTKQKREFQQFKILSSCQAANRHAAQRFQDLYQLSIDLGAHPNEQSVTGNMKMIKEKGRRTMQAVIQHGDGVQLELALKTVAQCAMVSFELLQVPLNARFELLGVNATLLRLRTGL